MRTIAGHMCGIAGIIDFQGRPVAEAELAGACSLLRHRGPDDQGIWTHGSGNVSAGLAHTRLAVFDPTPRGRQPMLDVQGRHVIVYNGAIYNYQELKQELLALGCRFHTETDTEVLLQGHLLWGEKMLERLNGMWAFCIYDSVEQQGMLARDRFGIKPLVYAQLGGRLAFASELAALTALAGGDQELCPNALHHYLRFGYVAHPQTIYRDCRRLAPGHVLRFDARGVKAPQRYHHLDVDRNVSGLSYVEAGTELRSRLKRSIQARLVSDVPVGAFLSGGLDSSIVVHHLAALASGAVRTFSLGFKDQPRYDETHYARLVADHCGTEHTVLAVGFDEVVDHLPLMLDHLGEPFADASLIPTSLVSRHARQAVKVALSGDGADELFGGYYRYLGHHYLRRYLRLPRALRLFVEPLIAVLPASKTGRFSDRVRQARKLLRVRERDPVAGHFMWSRILSPEAEQMLDPGGAMPYFPAFETLVEEVLGPELHGTWAADPLNIILLTDLCYQLPSDMLCKVDLASMYHGLEVRVPLLDPAVVQLAASLPSHYKIRGTSRKRILADAHRGDLPGKVLNRRKMGFELPIGEFLRRELRDMFLSMVTRDVVQQLPPLDFDGVMQVYQDHLDRRAENADILYALLVLCWWRQRRR